MHTGPEKTYHATEREDLLKPESVFLGRGEHPLCVKEKFLGLFADDPDKLADEQGGNIKRHLRICPRCSGRLAEIRNKKTVLWEP